VDQSRWVGLLSWRCLYVLLQPAPSASRAATQPWAGVAGFWSPATDPWQIPYLREFRTEFFNKALQWISNPKIKTFPVNEVR